MKYLAAIPVLCAIALLGFLGYAVWLHWAAIWAAVLKISSFILFWTLCLVVFRAIWHLGSYWKRKP